MTMSQCDFGRQAPKVGRARTHSTRPEENGFTLIELMVVMAIIGVLAGLLLPALSRSKARAQSIVDMNNKKQLLWGWTMYTADNSSRLAYNLQIEPTRGSTNNVNSALAAPTGANWVLGTMDWNTQPVGGPGGSDNTNIDLLTSANSLLAPYVSFSANMYHCPVDRALSDVQRGAGWTYRVRSVSMNAMVGDPGALMQGGANINNTNYQQFIKESDINDPSAIFVFLDEHPDSINDGYFLITENQTWNDLPASYHNGAGSFSFADGHAVIHRWQDSTTIQPPVPDIGLPIWLHSNQLTDFNWLLRHSSTERASSSWSQ